MTAFFIDAFPLAYIEYFRYIIGVFAVPLSYDAWLQ